MGQYWKIIAPEKEEQFDSKWDKLGELMFNCTAEKMIIHLAVPQAERVHKKLSPVPLY
jgi:hypothetical protein